MVKNKKHPEMFSVWLSKHNWEMRSAVDRIVVKFTDSHWVVTGVHTVIVNTWYVMVGTHHSLTAKKLQCNTSIYARKFRTIVSSFCWMDPVTNKEHSGTMALPNVTANMYWWKEIKWDEDESLKVNILLVCIRCRKCVWWKQDYILDMIIKTSTNDKQLIRHESPQLSNEASTRQYCHHWYNLEIIISIWILPGQ